MSKKSISILLAVMLLLTSNSNLLYAYADSLISTAEESEVQSGPCGENVTWTLSNGVLTISGSGNMYNYNDYSSIPWYLMREKITEVKIEDGVSSIGDYAFSDCSRLVSIEIPKSVTYIGSYAFSGCSRLASITIPYSVTSVKSYTFSDCINLVGITIPASVTSIEDGAFSGCTSLKSITVPNSVKTMGNYVFKDSSILNEIIMESTKAPTISNYTFSGTSDLLQIVVPKYATGYDSSLWKSYKVYEKYEDGLLWGKCGDDVKYNLYNGVLTISGSGDMYTYSSYSYGSYSYAPWYLMRNEITQVKIEDGVSSIGAYAFYNCSKLASVTIPASVKSIGTYAFSDCTSLTSVVIPNSVRTIESYLFNGCTSLTNVVIPDSVRKIGSYAFKACSSLASIEIPESVASIGEGAFLYCKSLASITIPELVTSIASRAFSFCESLTSFTIPNSVTSIEHRAFSYCKSLTSITIPKSVTSIGINAFEFCTSLTEVVMECAIAPTISSGIFYGTIGEFHIVVPLDATGYDSEPWTSYNVYKKDENGSAFGKCGENVSWSLRNGVLTISGSGDMSFISDYYAPWYSMRDEITEVKFEYGVTSAGGLGGCTNLKSVTISDSVTTIGSFGNCTSLESITIPASVTSIEGYFSGCTGLKKIIMKGSKAPSLDIYTLSGLTATTIIPADATGYSEWFWPNIMYMAAVPSPTATITSSGEIQLKWDADDTADKFEVYRSDSETGEYIKLVTTNSNSYTDNAVELARTYYYRVKAINETDPDLNSELSKVVSVKVAVGTEALFPESSNSIRVDGANRYDTAISTANSLKTSMRVEKFENIVVAYGNDYADALAGSYLAKAKNSPILIVNNGSESKIKAYIESNLASGGTVYLLGGTGVVSTDFEKSLSKYNVKRLGGTNRFATNMEILQEAGVTGDDVLICSAYGFADSLSASAVGKPILLVGNTLTDEQKTYLASLGKKNYYIIGGTGAVSQDVENELKTYGSITRVAGVDRYETSAEVAKTFFKNGSEAVVLAYGLNFPDGLAGGPLAMSLGAPLLLVSSNSTNNASASAYVASTTVDKAICLGGSALISDTAVKEILGK
jgi:putative cell wall-binding protein